MPLDAHEQSLLIKGFSNLVQQMGYTGPAVEEDRRMGQPHYGHAVGSVGSPVDAFMISAERLVSQMSHVTELLTSLLSRAIEAEQPDPAKPETEAKPAAKRVGRPPKPKPDVNGAQPPQQPDAGGEMFPTSGNAPEGGEDIFGDQPQQPPPPQDKPAPQQQAQMTDVQVKDALRVYMQAWGTEGTMRLTELLTRVAGVKRFSDLPANKWGDVVAAANKELAGRA